MLEVVYIKFMQHNKNQQEIFEIFQPHHEKNGWNKKRITAVVEIKTFYWNRFS